ncbi:MAG: hypothetical protein HDT00_00270 [Bacteroidales bacterium]|nr:hypothetical protein [Bacteroidales bacterium]
MSNSDTLYGIYRQAVELKKDLEVFKANRAAKDAIEFADKLKNEIFKCVGIAAAYEKDQRYWEEKNRNHNK